MARRERRRYERRGLERSQRALLTGIEQADLAGASLLEIGCGVGYLHQRLLKAGAARAVGVDLSARMLEEARAGAKACGLVERTDYLEGDFLQIGGTLADADIVILDKVICCYPDARGLVERSLGKARRVYAFTIPRDRAFVRFGAGVMALAFRLLGSRFRPYVHDPESVDSWLRQQGFSSTYWAQTPIWQSSVYVRHGSS
ncbi:MAG: class I SAM-dependent methyltransferase [Acidiferrobacterales bacterium]|nr:class I SAM-dependent methyltransferase [Acidiferrobacterales bacterium]